jgi:hypothetical protein
VRRNHEVIQESRGPLVRTDRLVGAGHLDELVVQAQD